MKNWGGMVAALLMASCSHAQIGPTDTVYVSAQFTPEQQAAVIAAADEWHTATAGAVSLDMRIGDEPRQHLIAPGQLEPNVFGNTSCGDMLPSVTIHVDTAEIEGRAEDDSAALRQVVMHELLHGLMAANNHASAGLMRHVVDPGDHPCIDQEALDAFCVLYRCPREAKPTCLE